MRLNQCVPPHPSFGLRETPNATFPSRGRQRIPVMLQKQNQRRIAPALKAQLGTPIPFLWKSLKNFPNQEGQVPRSSATGFHWFLCMTNGQPFPISSAHEHGDACPDHTQQPDVHFYTRDIVTATQYPRYCQNTGISSVCQLFIDTKNLKKMTKTVSPVHIGETVFFDQQSYWMPYFLLNLSTRPLVSTSFCLPV